MASLLSFQQKGQGVFGKYAVLIIFAGKPILSDFIIAKQTLSAQPKASVDFYKF